MAVTTTARKRPSVAARRFGYLVAVLFGVAALCVVNVWPGWEAAPFLTGETGHVIELVNASIIVNMALNVLYLVRDPAWVKALGDVVTAAFGIVVMARIWQVFPFDFGGSTFDWALLARILLVLGIVGCAIGIVAGFVRFGNAVGPGSGRST